jgi:uncharacterized protein DUF5655
MAIDYGEKERAFIDGLKENSGRDLSEWMAAISAEHLPHRNDIIDWLRRQGFMFSKASWLERIHHNGGKPIYADAAKPNPRASVRRREKRASPASPPSPAALPEPVPLTSDIEALLAKAKAYRPLALYLIGQIKAARPGASLLPRATFIAIADPKEFARLGLGAKELRLHLALGNHPTDEALKKGAPGGGLGKEEALSHMLVLTDARQIDGRLLDLIERAAANVNG